MTDKRIIIDGVDVSGCEFYNTDDKTCIEVNGKYDTDICEFDKCENFNCYYKQLKRKEQECERLNEYSVGFARKCQKLELDVCHLKDKNYNLQRQIDQLKVENDELKEKIKELRQGWINCDKERNLQEANSEFNQRVTNRYKQTLTEIKKILEIHKDNKCAICPKFDECFEHPSCDNIILQKIRECEVK